MRAYWVDGRFYETIFNFFGPAWQVVRAGSVLGALVACWTLPRTRTWLLLSAAAKVPALILTRAYIYPMNTLLFTPAIASLPAETARELTERWIVADRIRFVVMFAGFLALLRAFRLPLPPAHQASDR